MAAIASVVLRRRRGAPGITAKAPLDFSWRLRLTKVRAGLLVFSVKTPAVPETVVPSSSELAT